MSPCLRSAWTAVALLSWLTLAPAAPTSRPLELTVDATDAPRGIFHARIIIPALPGPLVLAYPKWIQGEHGPSGPITQLAGLSITARGIIIPWRRDPLDMFLFQVEVPSGADSVSVDLDYLSPVESFGSGYGKTPNATPHVVIVDWHNLLVYPTGMASGEMPVRASLRLPVGWKHDGALPATAEPDGTLLFSPTSLNTLIDSPVLSGDHFRTEVIEGGEHSAWLSIAADRASALEVPGDQLTALRQLPLEAQALFGAHHYRSYHWLVALSDTLAADGLEHHESTDIRDKIGFFSDEMTRTSENYVFAHEYVHSWNGKFRRPQGLVTRDPHQSLDGELLWVYEGLTRYLQEILVGRSGMRTPEQSREYIAWKAGQQDRDRPGRRWRPLVDTAISVQDVYAAPDEWTAYRRSVDFYDESMLVWLEVDTILLQKTAGRRSLDDFCRDFFGGADGPPSVKPYTRDDVEATLARIAPYDWHGFFTDRIYELATRIPLDGISRAGWKLVYDARPNAFHRARATFGKTIDHTLSVGLMLSPSGVVKDVVIDSASWRGGFGPGMKIVAINGRKFTPEVIEEELNAAKKVTAPIQFAVEHGEELKTLRVDYHGGVLYAHLERDPSRPDLLTVILAPRRRPLAP